MMTTGQQKPVSPTSRRSYDAELGNHGDDRQARERRECGIRHSRSMKVAVPHETDDSDGR